MDFEEFKKEITSIIYDDGLGIYLSKYVIALEDVKVLLEKSATYLEQFEEKLKHLKLVIDGDNTEFDIEDPWIERITAALYLRYIIEILISVFVSNNWKKLKDNERINTGRISQIIEVLYENKELDIGIFKGVITNNSINLYIYKFWTKDVLKKNYDFLGEQIHHFHELNDDYITIEADSKLDFLKKAYEKTYKIFKKLKTIGSSIYNTLYNHMISVENDDVIVEIEGFKIKNFYPNKLLKFNKN